MIHLNDDYMGIYMSYALVVPDQTLWKPGVASDITLPPYLTESFSDLRFAVN